MVEVDECELYFLELKEKGKGPWIVIEDITKNPAPARRFELKSDAIRYRLKIDRYKGLLPTPCLEPSETEKTYAIGFINNEYDPPLVFFLTVTAKDKREAGEKMIAVMGRIIASLFPQKHQEEIKEGIVNLLKLEAENGEELEKEVPEKLVYAFNFLRHFIYFKESREKAIEDIENGKEPADAIADSFYTSTSSVLA